MSELTFSPEFETRRLPEHFRDVLSRLEGITGLVTTLHTPDDLRPCIFSRFLHVRRTTWTAQWLTRARIEHGQDLDSSEIAWLAWAHDINRWPFAHNAEYDPFTRQTRFDQAQDMERFWRENGLLPEREWLFQLRAIVNKESAQLSPEGRVVLLADMITGFIEDPLLAITALDFVPEFISADVAGLLCLPLAERAFRVRLLDLNQCLHVDRAINRFKKEFDSVFCEMAVVFINRYGFGTNDPLSSDSFGRMRAAVRQQFLATRLFPYNNEKISRGSLLRSRIVDPLLAVLGDTAASVLTRVDEAGVLALARDHGLIPSDSPAPFVPFLDYVAQHEPGLSFRNRCT